MRGPAALSRNEIRWLFLQIMLANSSLPGGFLKETFDSYGEKNAEASVCRAFANKLQVLVEKLEHTECETYARTNVLVTAFSQAILCAASRQTCR